MCLYSSIKKCVVQSWQKRRFALKSFEELPQSEKLLKSLSVEEQRQLLVSFPGPNLPESQSCQFVINFKCKWFNAGIFGLNLIIIQKL